MRKSKLANKRISVETLLDIIDETPLDRAKRSDVNEYIQDNQIKEGTEFVPNSIIYYLYATNPKYKQKFKRKGFFKHFSKIVTTKHRISPTVKGYKLEHKLTWTEEDMIQSRIMTRKEQYERVQQKQARKHKKKEEEKV